MSLELAIAANTAAVEKLTAALLSGAAPTEAAAGGNKRGGAKKDAAPAGASAGAPAAAQSAASAVAGGAAVSFKEVADVLVPYADDAGRNALVALLGRYGVKTAQDLKPGQYADIKAECEKLHAAHKAAPPTGAAGLI